MKKFIFIAVLVSFLAGCATTKTCSVNRPMAEIRIATHEQNRGYVNL